MFQTAHGGTLLLDEIGEMPLPLQSKLLRVIEDKRLTPIGSDRAVEVDVRFIATTNKDLQSEVDRGAFRRDLARRSKKVVPSSPPVWRAAHTGMPTITAHTPNRYRTSTGQASSSVHSTKHAANRS